MNYKIKIRGVVDPSWSKWLGGLRITALEDRGGQITLLTGSVPDQPALFAILERLRDMNLLPISVEQIDGEACSADRQE